MPAGDSYAAWRDRLATANDPAFWPIEAFDKLLERNEAQFWANDEAAMVTRVAVYPGGAVAIEVMAAAGNLKALIALTPNVNAWGLSIGATHIMVIGRPGWARALPDWRHHQSILIKEVAHG